MLETKGSYGGEEVYAKKVGEIARHRLSGYFLSRLAPIEEAIAAYNEREQEENISFCFSFSDKKTYVQIEGTDFEDAGSKEYERIVRIRPVEAEEWNEIFFIRYSADRDHEREHEHESSGFRYLAPDVYTVAPDGEKLAIDSTPYAVTRIDAAMDMLDRVWAITEQLLPKQEATEPLALEESPLPPIRFMSTPHGEAAGQWLSKVAKRIPVLGEEGVDKKIIASARLGESEKKLSPDTINGFSSHFIARLAAVIKAAPDECFSSERDVYYTDGTVLFQIKGDDDIEVDAQGNMVQIHSVEREISLTPIQEGESATETLERVRNERDYPWEVVIVIENGVDMKNNISYFERDAEFCLGKARGAGKKRERLPLCNTPRALKLTESVIDRLERIVA